MPKSSAAHPTLRPTDNLQSSIHVQCPKLNSATTVVPRKLFSPLFANILSISQRFQEWNFSPFLPIISERRFHAVDQVADSSRGPAPFCTHNLDVLLAKDPRHFTHP